MAKGTDFEKQALEFFEGLFKELGYTIIAARNQRSGTQNGFDIMITFLDKYERERIFCLECKNYETQLRFEAILVKLHELDATSYDVDGFLAISPKEDISNIDDHMKTNFSNKFNFPIRHWTPETGVKEIFSLDPKVYREIYGEDPKELPDRSQILKKVEGIIDRMLDAKDGIEFAKK